MVPIAATVASVALVLGASSQQLLAGGAVLATGALVRAACRARRGQRA